MSGNSASVRLNQLTRALISQSNDIWSFRVSWCRFVHILTDDHADCPHKHSLYEIQIAIDGGLDVVVDSSVRCSVTAGQFILLPPQLMHSISFSKSISRKLVIAFAVEGPNETIKKALENNHCTAYDITPSIQRMIEAIHLKLAESNELSPYILSFLLQGLILEALNVISPNILCEDNKTEQTLNSSRLEQANNFISGNILCPVSGNDLAQELGITVRHLNRIYHAAYGYSVNKQIQKMRIAYAQRLLNTTNLSLADIAESMQYSSVYSFIRAFSNIAGMSPGKYRKGTIMCSSSKK